MQAYFNHYYCMGAFIEKEFQYAKTGLCSSTMSKFGASIELSTWYFTKSIACFLIYVAVKFHVCFCTKKQIWKMRKSPTSFAEICNISRYLWLKTVVYWQYLFERNFYSQLGKIKILLFVIIDSVSMVIRKWPRFNRYREMKKVAVSHGICY